MVLQQARHYMRFLRHDMQGETAETIAKTEGVSVKAVERSFTIVRMHRAINNHQNLNTAVVGMLMGNLGKADKTMGRMLNAKNYLEHTMPDGTKRYEAIDNPKVQLQALEIFGRYIESMQPKATGNVLKIQQNNANVNTPATNAKSGGFEEVLHGVIDKVRSTNALPFATADVIEAEEEDGNDEEGEE